MGDRYVMVSQADLTFDSKPCKVLNIRDMTSFQELSESKREVEMSQMLSSTVTHEVMTPLNCVETFTRCIQQAED